MSNLIYLVLQTAATDFVGCLKRLKIIQMQHYGSRRNAVSYARLQREEQRRQKELARQRKEYAKLSQLEQARLEVEEDERRIVDLYSIHKVCAPDVD